jgi:hypothetical protein
MTRKVPESVPISQSDYDDLPVGKRLGIDVCIDVIEYAITQQKLMSKDGQKQVQKLIKSVGN